MLALVAWNQHSQERQVEFSRRGGGGKRHGNGRNKNWASTYASGQSLCFWRVSGDSTCSLGGHCWILGGCWGEGRGGAQPP